MNSSWLSMFTWAPSDLFHSTWDRGLAIDDIYSLYHYSVSWEETEGGRVVELGCGCVQPGHFFSEFVKTTVSGADSASSTEGKSLDFRSFPQFRVNQPLWEEMRLARSPLVHSPLVLWVSRFLLTTYSSAVYSLPLDFIYLLVGKLRRVLKKAWWSDFIVWWLAFSSILPPLMEEKGSKWLFLSFPSPVMTSALGPDIRQILYGGLFRMSSNCTTAPSPPKAGELRVGPNCATLADTFWILYILEP